MKSEKFTFVILLTPYIKLGARVTQSPNVFRRFYDRKKPIIGTGEAIIALARKIATLIWRLITNDELFNHKEEGIYNPSKLGKVRIPSIVTLEEILKIFKEAAIVLKEPDPGNG